MSYVKSEGVYCFFRNFQQFLSYVTLMYEYDKEPIAHFIVLPH